MKCLRLQQQAGAPAARIGHSWTPLADGRVVLFGGGFADGVSNELHVFDTRRLAWVAVDASGTPPCPRYQHSATLVGERVVVFGGADQNGTFNDVFILDTETMTWQCPSISGTPPCARNMHSAAAIGSKIYVFGGASSFDQAVLDGRVHCLDLETCTWTTPVVEGVGPTPRFGHSCTALGQRLFFFGGMDESGEFNQRWVLDTQENRWHEIKGSDAAAGKTEPMPRAGHTSTPDPAAPTTRALICGGFSREAAFSDVWSVSAIDQDCGLKRIQGEAPLARLGHSAAQIGDKTWLYGGADFSRLYDDVLVLDSRRSS